jgi:hypothetical protein
MKKSFFILGIVFTCLFLFTACQTPTVHPPPQAIQQPADACVPTWAEETQTAEDAIYGVGDAKKMSRSLSKQAADSRARTEIARTLELKVSAMFKDYEEQAGGEDGQFTQLVQNTSKQIAKTTLRGCKIEKRKYCPDGTVWSLAVLPRNQATQSAKAYINNQKAAFNRFMSKQAFDELQGEIDKMDFNN